MTVERFKAHSLIGQIDRPRLYRAFQAVKRNHGAAGVDGVTLDMFEANLDQNLAALMHDLKQPGGYVAAAVRRVYLPKGNGRWRPLGIPTVRDRVAQEVVRSLLEPIFEPTFADGSFGFRPGRNAHQAITCVLQFIQQGQHYILDADIQAFFDNLPHELILDRVAERVADGHLLDVIRAFLTAPVREDGHLHPTLKGTPQGGVISPLLANIALDVLDQRLIQAGLRFARYADDFVVLCPSRTAAEQARTLVAETLHALGLTLAPDKTRVVSLREGFDFLGFRIGVNGVSVRPRSLKKFKDHIRLLTRRSHNFETETIQALNPVIRGFAQYFATPFATVRRQFRDLDEWLRMRLRCMKFKRISKWDNWRLLNRHLARLGLMSLYLFATDT